MYAVTAVVTRVTGDYASVRSLPTFYLDPSVQGFTSPAGAEVVAREIVAPFVRPEETVQVTVVNLDPEPTPLRTEHVWLKESA